MDYESADAYLGKKLDRPIGSGRHTRIVRNSGVLGDSIHIKLHDTYVVTFFANGDIQLDSGGWRTVTTKARMNEYLSGWHISQVNGQWYVTRHTDKAPYREDIALFADGMKIKADGTVEGGEPLSNENANRKLRRKVQKFAAKYMEAFKSGQIEKPGLGDCLYCGMRTVDENKPLGEAFKDKDHILSHLDEDYFVPSLLARAYETMPHSQAMGWAMAKAWSDDPQWKDSPVPEFVYGQLQKSLSRYILRQLGQAA